jgi:hypothetical protein
MSEIVVMKQSEAETDLQKYVLFKQKNEKLKKTIKDIQESNNLVSQTTAIIVSKVNEITPALA